MMKTFILSALLVFFSLQGFSQKKLTLAMSTGMGYGNTKVPNSLFEDVLTSDIALSAAYPLFNGVQVFTAVEYDSRNYASKRPSRTPNYSKQVSFTGFALGLRYQRECFFVSAAPFYTISLQKYDPYTFDRGFSITPPQYYKHAVEFGSQVQIAYLAQLTGTMKVILGLEWRKNLQKITYRANFTDYPLNHKISFKLGLLKELSIRA